MNTPAVDVASAGLPTVAFMCRACGHIIEAPAHVDMRHLAAVAKVHHHDAHPGDVGVSWTNLDKAADDYFRGVS